MTIETKFKINDLVMNKFQKNQTLENLSGKQSLQFMEVLYIHTETCSAGTQIFYRCRGYYPVISNKYDNTPIALLDFAFSIGGSDQLQGTYSFREDELVSINEETKKILGL
jgi:hypothetical protein